MCFGAVELFRYLEIDPLFVFYERVMTDGGHVGLPTLHLCRKSVAVFSKPPIGSEDYH